MSPADGARCARHPDAPATEACARCGDFFCAGCADPSYAGVCAPCAARLPHGIAWEDPRAGRLPWRFLLTLKDVLFRPSIGFPGPARVGPAFAFAALCGAGTWIACGVVIGAMAASDLPLPGPAPSEPAMIGGVALFLLGLIVSATLAAAALQSVSFAVGLRIAGRSRGLLRFAGRASGYAQGVVLALNAIMLGVNALALLEIVPLEVSWGTQLAALALWPTLSGRVWLAAARGLGLPYARSALAAIGPTLLCALPSAYASVWLLERAP